MVGADGVGDLLAQGDSTADLPDDAMDDEEFELTEGNINFEKAQRRLEEAVEAATAKHGLAAYGSGQLGVASAARQLL